MTTIAALLVIGVISIAYALDIPLLTAAMIGGVALLPIVVTLVNDYRRRPRGARLL